MVYDHTVKMNGEYYPSGTDVPERKEEEVTLPLSDSEIEFETQPVKRGRPKKN